MRKSSTEPSSPYASASSARSIPIHSPPATTSPPPCEHRANTPKQREQHRAILAHTPARPRRGASRYPRQPQQPRHRPGSTGQIRRSRRSSTAPFSPYASASSARSIPIRSPPATTSPPPCNSRAKTPKRRESTAPSSHPPARPRRGAPRYTSAAATTSPSALRAQGKNAEAEAEHRSVLAIRQRVLGAEHPDTLTTRNNLAAALRAQGKYAEAEEATPRRDPHTPARPRRGASQCLSIPATTFRFAGESGENHGSPCLCQTFPRRMDGDSWRRPPGYERCPETRHPPRIPPSVFRGRQRGITTSPGRLAESAPLTQHPPYPDGVMYFSPGLAERSAAYPGFPDPHTCPTPTVLCPRPHNPPARTQHLWRWNKHGPVPRGCLRFPPATPG